MKSCMPMPHVGLGVAQDIDLKGLLECSEWIKFMATFTNDEAKANTYMKQIVERYTCTQQVASELAGNKTVAFISISSFFGNVISLADYKLEFINHAGGINPFSMDAVTSFSDIAELAAAIADVDVLIDETYAPDPTAYTIVRAWAGWPRARSACVLATTMTRCGALAPGASGHVQGSLRRRRHSHQGY